MPLIFFERKQAYDILKKKINNFIRVENQKIMCNFKITEFHKISVWACWTLNNFVLAFMGVFHQMRRLEMKKATLSGDKKEVF